MNPKKGKDNVVQVEEETSAAGTLHPGAAPGESKSKMLATFTSLMAQLGKDDLSHFLNDALALIGHEADKIPGGAAAHNAATIAAKGAVKEDVAEMFAGEELSEEFQTKVSDLFEAAVEGRVILVAEQLQEEYEQKLEEELEGIKQDLEETLDKYLDYAATEWLKENKIAIQSSLKAELTEGFIAGLKNLFKEHYIEVPDEKVDMIGDLQTQVQEMQTKLDTVLNENIELLKVINEAEKEAAVDELAEGMVATQAEKFRKLAEGIEFTDVDSYKTKLGVIKEQHFSDKAPTSTKIITEEVEETDESNKAVPVSPQMRGYVDAIKRTVQKN